MLVDVMPIEKGAQDLLVGFRVLNYAIGVEDTVLLSAAQLIVDRLELIFNDFLLKALRGNSQFFAIPDKAKLFNLLNLLVLMVHPLHHEQPINFVQ
jgi:hypothetical protein